MKTEQLEEVRQPSASGKGQWLIIKPLGQIIRRVKIRAEISSKLLHLYVSLSLGKLLRLGSADSSKLSELNYLVKRFFLTLL
ncbi:MAG TPA: hypothetical protein DF774_03370 [Rheinheimera sp.]|uniref:hypothetical protein n=1 Tax=Rheinheimera sp. TaxID=1869214 RepID=UPI000ED1FB9E|nr:hypothetical protein [Rheinheimera sp.]HCU64780.1 hypothetical protein [Rheinheimera sp.]